MRHEALIDSHLAFQASEGREAQNEQMKAKHVQL